LFYHVLALEQPIHRGIETIGFFFVRINIQLFGKRRLFSFAGRAKF
jgi:hypothetical protein